MTGERAPTVLLTADTVGGVWTYGVELSRALTARGVHVHLATMGGPVSEHQRAQLAGTHHLWLHESHWRLEWMNSPWEDVQRAGEWLQALETKLQPDVVHLNQFAFGALRFKAPTLLVAHSCVRSWWRAVRGEAAPPEWDTYSQRVAHGLAGATLVAAPTQAMLKALTAEYGFAGDGIVLPNARDPALFAPADKQAVILSAGRLWDDAKNLAALESVAAALPWPVQVVGSCAAPDGSQRQPRAVQALGELPSPVLAQAMARAAIYALPARYEPFGLSVLEAALSGCALVLGDIPSLREVWGDTALYVPPSDTAALHAALLRLIGSPAERERLAQAARGRALLYSPRRQAQHTLAAYARLKPVLSPQLGMEEATCA